MPELKELILNRAAGNPLFMEELTQPLFEERESGQGIRVSQEVGGEGGPE